MIIGVVKEIKNHEERVAVTPQGIAALTAAGHTVRVEKNAGAGSGYVDLEYQQAGGQLVDAKTAWRTDLVVKVKEPLPSEYAYCQGQMIFTFFHLAGAPIQLTERLLQSKTSSIAYETLEDEQGHLPILAPMSAVAGNMATLVGAFYLAKFNAGKGIQLGKILGKSYGKVLVIGDGTVGRHAAHVALSMGASVYLAGLNEAAGQTLIRTELPGAIFLISKPEVIAEHVANADLVIGAVLKKGAKAPYVVSTAMIKQMVAGSVVVDVSIDQGGCVETSRPTTHSDPVFIKHDIVHYCVTNMPGAYPRTSTQALCHASLPYLLQLADNGLAACAKLPGFAKAINTYAGYLCNYPVAAALNKQQSYRLIEALF